MLRAQNRIPINQSKFENVFLQKREWFKWTLSKQPCEWDQNSDTIKKIYRWNLLSFALALRRWSSQPNRLTCPMKSNLIFLHILQGFHSLTPFLLKSIESSMSKLSSTLFVGHFSGMFFLLQDISGIEFLQK